MSEASTPAATHAGNIRTALGTLAGTTAILAIVAVYAPDEVLRANLWAMYLAQYALVVGILLLLQDRWLFVLSPSFVTLSYINFNNVLGSLCFKLDLVYLEKDYVAYLGWQHLGETAALFLYFNLAVVLVYFLVRKDGNGVPLAKSVRPAEARRPAELILSLSFCVGVLVAFSTFEWDLSAVGAAANSSPVVRALACLAIVLVVAKHLGKWRYLVYAALLLYMSSISSEDKRDAIFLIVPVVLVECIRLGQLRLGLKLLAVSASLAGVALVLIVVMSIHRGYGDYGTKSFWDAVDHVADYVQSDDFLGYLGNNLEFNYAFFHAHQAVEYVYEKPELLLHGSTFAKVLFIHVPRGLFPAKPDSMSTHYTRYHAPDLEARGASWMSTIYAEMFWNFHVAGLLALAAVYYLANRLFVALAYWLRSGLAYRQLFAVFVYFHMMTVVRGNGFDEFFAYILLGGAVALIVFAPGLALCAYMGGERMPAVSFARTEGPNPASGRRRPTEGR